MKKALIRLEDVGPGGEYATEESLWKLRVVADFLAAEQVPFHVALIPRFVDPKTGYDKSVADLEDPYVRKFCATIEYLQARGGSLGLHGDRHQYDTLPSAAGFEFYYANCQEDCVPDDPPAAFLERDAFEKSYVSARMREAWDLLGKSGLQAEWFETPHYTAEGVQRWELESWVGLLFENDPLEPELRTVSIKDIDAPLYRGVVYVPTPLYYVDGSKPDAEVERITEEIRSFGERELAAFFYHPLLEFPFIRQVEAEGRMQVVYEEHSYLKRLIRAFRAQQFQFVPLLRLLPFVPSARQSDFFPGEDYEVYTGDVDGDRYSELLIRQKSTGRWWQAKGNLDAFPSRQTGAWQVRPLLDDWVRGEGWQVFVADWNGDGRADVGLWHPGRGEWRFAVSDGERWRPQERWRWDGVASGERFVPFVGDFDGDKCAEVALWDRWGKQCCRWLDGEWQPCLTNGSIAYDARPVVGDFNGDGLDDVAFVGNGTCVVAFSDGRRFALDVSNLPLLTGWAQGAHWQVLAGDFNGDGLCDLLAVDAASGDWQVALRDAAGQRFVALPETLQPWAAGAEMQPLVGYFTADGRASVAARHKRLRNGVIDFAVSVIGRR